MKLLQTEISAGTLAKAHVKCNKGAQRGVGSGWEGRCEDMGRIEWPKLMAGLLYLSFSKSTYVVFTLLLPGLAYPGHGTRQFVK